MTRREAITLSAAALAGCATPGSSSRGYIDAHSHIWSPDVQHFPLALGKTVADLKPRSFTPETLIKLGKTEDVTRHVLISHGPFTASIMIISFTLPKNTPACSPS